MSDLSDEQSVPEGWKLVPVQLTEEMRNVLRETVWRTDCLWVDLLSAAPKAPQSDDKRDADWWRCSGPDGRCECESMDSCVNDAATKEQSK
jgi:hypothetical protein